jgi:hypothetical protein
LHEYFGFTIYTPLTPEEEDKLKHDGYIPSWMPKFTSLPNIAIPISYFCIGVALQLLRTPLIVYFIQDRGATPAEVNVLFTVSKCKPTRGGEINGSLYLSYRKHLLTFVSPSFYLSF